MSLELYERLLKNKRISSTRPTNDKIYAANHTAIEVLSECSIRIKIHKFSWKINCLVTKESCVPLIIGSQFMSKTGLTLDIGNKLRLCFFNFKPCCKVTIFLREHSEYLNLVSTAIDIQGEINYLKNKYQRVFQDKIGLH